MAKHPAKQPAHLSPFLSALLVVSIPLLFLVLLPFLLIYLLFTDASFWLFIKIMIFLGLIPVWFVISRNFLKKHGWKSPMRPLIFGFLAGLLPYFLLMHDEPLLALALFVFVMQIILMRTRTS